MIKNTTNKINYDNNNDNKNISNDNDNDNNNKINSIATNWKYHWLNTWIKHLQKITKVKAEKASKSWKLVS